MGDTYRYSSLFRSAEYSFTAEGVAVTSRRFGHFTRTTVSFDKIPVRSSTIRWSSKPLWWATIIFAILSAVVMADLVFGKNPEPAGLVLYVAICAVCAAAYVVSRTTSELFSFGDEHLAIFRRVSTEPDFTSFIQALQKRKLQFFKDRVSRRASEVSAEEIARYLIYLRDYDLVDDAGYDVLKAYHAKLHDERNRIGFR